MELKACCLAKQENFIYGLVEQHTKQLSYKFQKKFPQNAGGGAEARQALPLRRTCFNISVLLNIWKTSKTIHYS